MEDKAALKLTQTRESSGQRVSGAKTYTDKTKQKCRLLAKSQWP